MKFSQYALYARIFPAIITAVPFFVFYYFALIPTAGNFMAELLHIKWIGEITLSAVVLYFIAQLNRVLSKELEKRIFDDGLQFPTVTCLLHSDNYYSPEHTKQIHKKIEKDFEIVIPSEGLENDDEATSRKCIKEALTLIRTKVFKGKLTYQHNMEYGFIRNLAGGSIVGVIVSVINFFVFSFFYHNTLAVKISISLLIGYLIILLFSKWLIKRFSHNYGTVLIQEYLSLN